jgi:ABC-type lipoprotein export system ATPase subunit
VITHEHEIAARFARQIALRDGQVVTDGRGAQARTAAVDTTQRRLPR